MSEEATANKPKNHNEELLYYTDPVIHAKINLLLEQLRTLESNNGRDSTTEERAKFIADKQAIYLQIKELDPLMYIRLKPAST